MDALETEISNGTLRKITSVLVAQDGRLRSEAYFDGDRDALRNTRSVTKTVAGILVGVAIDRGELPGVDVPLLSFFDDLGPIRHDGPPKRAITLRDVLTMSSALDCDDADPASPGNEEVMYETPDWLRFALDIPVRATGGGSFHYCTAGVTALAGVLERATRQPLDTYADSHLFTLLGIRGARWFRSPTGLVQTGGGLELRSRDLLALGQLALDGGVGAGTRVVSEAWVRASMAPAVRVDDTTQYGYLWWLRSFPLGGRTVRVALMQGNGGSKVAVIPDLRAVAVITSTNYGTPGMHEQTDRILVRDILPSLR